MDVVPPFVADAEASELMQPGDGAFDHPAEDTQAAPVWRIAASQDGDDALRAQLLPVRVRVVGAIALDTLRSVPGPAPCATDRRNSLHEREELRHIVPVGFRESDGQGDAVRIRNEVMLAPQLPSIRRIRTRFFPPRRARMEDESTIARDQSSWSAAWSWASHTR